MTMDLHWLYSPHDLGCVWYNLKRTAQTLVSTGNLFKCVVQLLKVYVITDGLGKIGGVTPHIPPILARLRCRYEMIGETQVGIE